MDLTHYWATIAVLGIGTFLLRLSFIQAMDRCKPPPVVNRLLRFIPAAVLPAIVAPALFLEGSRLNLSWGNARLMAAALATVIAWRYRNMFLTIVVGMVALWVLEAAGLG
jgi:branched-subunit amino acid transport protein